MIDPFKNLAVNLKATGPATVLVAWIAGVVVLGIFGTGESADRAFGLLAIAGGLILITLAARA